MTQEKSPPRPAGLSGAGLAAPSAERAALTTGHPYYTPRPAGLSTPVIDLPGLALDAQAKAETARLLAEACRLIGDLAGWEHWRRQLLAHQAIAWQASHPQRQPQEVIHE